MGIVNKIWEHLITKRKYNKLEIKYMLKQEELENKIVELNTERMIHKKRKDVYENTISELTQEVLELKFEIKKLKKKNKENKNV